MITTFGQHFGGSHQLLWIILCFATLGHNFANQKYSRTQLLIQSMVAVTIASSYDALKPFLSLMPAWSMAGLIAFLSYGMARVKGRDLDLGVEQLAVVRVGETDPVSNADAESPEVVEEEIKSGLGKGISYEDLLAGLQLSISNCYRPQIKLVSLKPPPNPVQGRPDVFAVENRADSLGSADCGDGPSLKEAKVQARPISEVKKKLTTRECNDGGHDVTMQIIPTGDPEKDKSLVQRVKAAMDKIAIPKKTARNFFAKDDTKGSSSKASQLTINNYGKANAVDTSLSDATEKIKTVCHLDPGDVNYRRASNRQSFSPFRSSKNLKDVSMEPRSSSIKPMTSVLTRKDENDEENLICNALNLNDTVESWSPLLESLSMDKLREPPPPTPSLSKTWKDEFALCREVKKLSSTPASKLLSVDKSAESTIKDSKKSERASKSINKCVTKATSPTKQATPTKPSTPVSAATPSTPATPAIPATPEMPVTPAKSVKPTPAATPETPYDATECKDGQGDGNMTMGYGGDETVYVNATKEPSLGGLAGPFYLAIGDKLPPGLIPVDINVNKDNRVILESQEFCHSFATLPLSSKFERSLVASKTNISASAEESEESCTDSVSGKSRYNIGFMVSLSLFLMAISQVLIQFYVRRGEGEAAGNLNNSADSDTIGRIAAALDQRLMIPRHTWFTSFDPDQIETADHESNFFNSLINERGSTKNDGKQGSIDWEYILKQNKIVGMGLICITMLWHLSMLVIPVLQQIVT